MFHRNHKSITNFKYFPQNKAHEFAKLLVHHCVCLVHKEAMKIPQPLPKPIKGVRELTGLLVIDWETSPIPQKQCMYTEELFGGPLLKMRRKKPLSSSKSNHCWHDYLNTIRFTCQKFVANSCPQNRHSLKNVTFSKPGSFAVAFYLTFEVKCPPCEPQTSTLPATNIFAPENG